MSLYNMVHGTDGGSGFVLKVLGYAESDIPRFRDAWIDVENKRLCIYTRTGGGNRDYYDHPETYESNFGTEPGYCDDPYKGPFNSDLREHPNYVRDADDGYDSTYATFYFTLPAGAGIPEGAETPPSPAERWTEVIEALRKKAPE